MLKNSEESKIYSKKKPMLSPEEVAKRLTEFRLMDDIYFEVFAEDKKACQEIIRTILQDDSIEVIEAVTQRSIKNIYGRSVRLDALCRTGDGRYINIEIQRADNDDHLRRARFNSSSITVKCSREGTDFRDVADVIIIYISEHDFFRRGKTTYHVVKVLKETGEEVDDGLQEIFVNMEVDDGSQIARLMGLFTKPVIQSPEFPEISRRNEEIKSTEGGLSVMCEAMKDYMQQAMEEGREVGRAEGRAEGEAKGRAEERQQAISLLYGKGFSLDQILDLGYTKEEIAEAIAD